MCNRVECSLGIQIWPDFMVAWMKTRLKGYSIHTDFRKKGYCSTYTPIVMAGPLFQPIRGVIFALAFYPIQSVIFVRPYGWLMSGSFALIVVMISMGLLHRLGYISA